jgi:predicted TPR repeat methyltransferase
MADPKKDGIERQNIQPMFDAALKAHQSGNLAAAGQIYRDILNLDPAHADSLHLLGMLSSQLGRHAEAVELIGRAIVARGNAPAYHNTLGLALKNLGRMDEAAACYGRVLALKPDYPDAHNNLGTVLALQNRLEAAAESYGRAVALAPKSVNFRRNLGVALKNLKKYPEAAEQFRACLALDPADAQGVRLLLSDMGMGAMPEQASEAQIQNLYTQRANVWDEAASSADPYRGHVLVAEAFERLRDKNMQADILDAGCGTGLVGALVRAHARRLEGIDLSAAMLEKARAKNIYDHLFEGDMIGFMAGAAQKYDAITCAATLIHFGDLAPALDAAVVALRDGGRLICTLFPNEADENGVSAAALPGLAQGGCYAHGRTYIRDAAGKAGFAVEMLEAHIHEYSKGVPRQGLVVALRRC